MLFCGVCFGVHVQEACRWTTAMCFMHTGFGLV